MPTTTATDAPRVSSLPRLSALDAAEQAYYTFSYVDADGVEVAVATFPTVERAVGTLLYALRKDSKLGFVPRTPKAVDAADLALVLFHEVTM